MGADMKSNWIGGIIIALVFSSVPIVHGAPPADSGIKIETVDASSESNDASDNQEAKNDAGYQRSENVSQYGTVPVVQKPLEWSGKGLDGIVWGIGKVASAIITLPTRPFQKKTEGGKHG